MRNRILAIALVLALSVSVLGGAFAQNSSKRAVNDTSPAKPDPTFFQKEMAKEMIPMIEGMMEGMMDAQLRVLIRPETVEQMATFARNYYDALVAKGFSEAQALDIVVATGLPPVPTLGN